MKKMSRENQKLVYWLIECYAYYLANIDISDTTAKRKPKISEFYRYKAKEELKKIYLKVNGENVKNYAPFNDLDKKIYNSVKTILKKESEEDKKIKLIAELLQEQALQELQNFLIKIEGTFSLSLNLMSNEQAQLFTRFLFDYFTEHDVAMWDEIRELVNEQDGRAYVYTMLKNRCCAVCGVKHDENNTVDLDHFKTVGSMGGYKHDKGQGVYISLCRRHHQEKHAIGVTSFINKYFLKGIELKDEEIKELKKIYKNHFKAYEGEDEKDRFKN